MFTKIFTIAVCLFGIAHSSGLYGAVSNYGAYGAGYNGYAGFGGYGAYSPVTSYSISNVIPASGYLSGYSGALGGYSSALKGYAGVLGGYSGLGYGAGYNGLGYDNLGSAISSVSVYRADGAHGYDVYGYGNGLYGRYGAH